MLVTVSDGHPVWDQNQSARHGVATDRRWPRIWTGPPSHGQVVSVASSSALSPGGVIAAQASAMGRVWSLLRAPPRSWGRESYSSQHISAMHLSAHDVDGGGEELGVDACGGAVAGQSS